MNQDERNHVYQIAKISGTPTTIFIENGIEKDSSNRIVGISSKSNIINKLKENHYLE